MYRDWAIHVYLYAKMSIILAQFKHFNFWEKFSRTACLLRLHLTFRHSQTQTGFQRLAKSTYLSYFVVKTIILNDEKLRQVDRPSLLNRPELRLVELWSLVTQVDVLLRLSWPAKLSLFSDNSLSLSRSLLHTNTGRVNTRVTLKREGRRLRGKNCWGWECRWRCFVCC
jgi:hypothetical protein